jgi:hypothetical protein
MAVLAMGSAVYAVSANALITGALVSLTSLVTALKESALLSLLGLILLIKMEDATSMLNALIEVFVTATQENVTAFLDTKAKRAKDLPAPTTALAMEDVSTSKISHLELLPLIMIAISPFKI